MPIREIERDHTGSPNEDTLTINAGVLSFERPCRSSAHRTCPCSWYQVAPIPLTQHNPSPSIPPSHARHSWPASYRWSPVLCTCGQRWTIATAPWQWGQVLYA